MKYSSQRIAGAVLLIGLAQFLLFLQIAQDLYPHYSTSQNYISDLGATCRFPSVPCTNGPAVILHIQHFNIRPWSLSSHQRILPS